MYPTEGLPVPIVALLGQPAKSIVSNYVKNWRPNACQIDNVGDYGDIVELLSPDVVLMVDADLAAVERIAKLPFGMVVTTEARLGPYGLVAGIRSCFLPIGLDAYTPDHMATANALVIEAHIRRCRRMVGKS